MSDAFAIENVNCNDVQTLAKQANYDDHLMYADSNFRLEIENTLFDLPARNPCHQHIMATPLLYHYILVYLNGCKSNRVWKFFSHSSITLLSGWLLMASHCFHSKTSLSGAETKQH
jgi:hypothetical protein